ncbi:MAG TPA: MJ0042-type zinc finger domain-containing protein [Pseudolabrys sp.]|nr:MJ0042-type zinc finger domain-containing protein [Pseudolabrys sp.]
MLIVCPNCATSYMIDQATLGPAGRTVRCARCKSTWFAGSPHSEPEPEQTTAEHDGGIFVDGIKAEAGASTAMSPLESGDAAAEVEHFTPVVADLDAPHVEPLAPAPADAFEQSEAIVDSPPLAPSESEAASPESDPADSGDIESFAARRLRLQSRRKRSRRSSRWTAVVLLLFAFNVAVVGARNEVVHYLPQTASLFSAIGLPVNLRHLEFKNVRIARTSEGGTTMLVVQGSIVSTSSKPIEVPRLHFAARNKAGQEVYTWTMQPDRSVLQPGERLDFRSAIGSPPKDAVSVLVRFLTVADAIPAAK